MLDLLPRSRRARPDDIAQFSRSDGLGDTLHAVSARVRSALATCRGPPTAHRACRAPVADTEVVLERPSGPGCRRRALLLVQSELSTWRDSPGPVRCLRRDRPARQLATVDRSLLRSHANDGRKETASCGRKHLRPVRPRSRHLPTHRRGNSRSRSDPSGRLRRPPQKRTCPSSAPSSRSEPRGSLHRVDGTRTAEVPSAASGRAAGVRPAAPRPPNSSVPCWPPKSCFPPRPAKRVSADLQAEIDEVLGDLSIDALLAAESRTSAPSRADGGIGRAVYGPRHQV